MKGYSSQGKGKGAEEGGEGGEGGKGRRRSFMGSFFFFFSAGSFLKQVYRPQMMQVLAQKSSNIDNRISTGVDD